MNENANYFSKESPNLTKLINDMHLILIPFNETRQLH